MSEKFGEEFGEAAEFVGRVVEAGDERVTISSQRPIS